MHKLQWRYASRPDLGVLALAGQLGAADVPRLNGAIGWTLFHGGGPLILDLSALYRWTTLGQDAIVKAAARLQAAGRTLDIAAAPGSDTSIIAGAI
ncbi:anti-sigma factor antagonist, partial [Catenulispora rubra]|uniref:anti-sigma factor antagonist n=1 Tax=Catenulispora rubra TaxID=280293 RepID=UPI0018927BF1